MFMVGTTVVTQKAKGHLLSQQQALEAIRAVVHARGVAPQRNVARQLVDFMT